MTQQIYGLIENLGDGSSCMRWFRSREKVDAILEDESQCEWFGMNEGCAEQLTFPDGLDLKVCGFSFSDESY